MTSNENFGPLDWAVGLWFVLSALAAGIIAGFMFPTIEGDGSGGAVEVFNGGPMLAGIIVAAIANIPFAVLYVVLKRLVLVTAKKNRTVAV